VRKVLVTGAAGFVGGTWWKRLLEAGDDGTPWTRWRSIPEASIRPGRASVRPADYPRFHFHKGRLPGLVRTGEGYGFRLRIPPWRPWLAASHDLRTTRCGGRRSGDRRAYWDGPGNAGRKKTACSVPAQAYPIKLQGPEGYVLLKEDMICSRAISACPT